MVIGVALQFEQHIVGEAVGSVPTVTDVDFFVLSVGQLLPPESKVLEIVDGL